MDKLTDCALQAEQNRLLSHDLRSAVSDILGGVTLLEQDSLSDANKAQIARISAAADMVLRLLDAVKSGSSALEKPSAARHSGPLSVVPFLQAVEQRWQGRVAGLALGLEFRIDLTAQCQINCAPLDLERILSNLLDNAVKFSPKGGKITLEAREEAGNLRLHVCDQGAGFSASAREMLFSYEGRPENSEIPGSGLGLYIVWQIVQRLQGDVQVAASDVGASITVVLPLHCADTAGQPAQEPDPAGGKLQGMRVLLAEDNKTNQLVASQMLHVLGAEVTIAKDGIEAWERLCRQEFDLALVDIEMPRKSGLELIRDIRRAEKSFSNMPLVALTAYFLADHQNRIMQAGANGVIAKPLTDIDALGVAINRFCRNEPVVAKAKKPVDLQTYNSLKKTMGKTAFGGLVDKLLIDLRGVQTRLEKAFRDHDRANLRSASHILISLAGAVGALELLKAAQSLNTAVHGVESDDLTSSGWLVLPLLRELIEYLETVHNEINGG
jgi:CheY-like chemotaxis protein